MTMGYYDKNSSEIYETPLNFALCGPYLDKTDSVRPMVNLSWKANLYDINMTTFNKLSKTKETKRNKTKNVKFLSQIRAQ